jgi:hypothetical protein
LPVMTICTHYVYAWWRVLCWPPNRYISWLLNTLQCLISSFIEIHTLEALIVSLGWYFTAWLLIWDVLLFSFIFTLLETTRFAFGDIYTIGIFIDLLQIFHSKNFFLNLQHIHYYIFIAIINTKMKLLYRVFVSVLKVPDVHLGLLSLFWKVIQGEIRRGSRPWRTVCEPQSDFPHLRFCGFTFFGV